MSGHHHRLVLSLVLLTPASAMGQIDHRINNQPAGTDGRLLDRNPLVGSGGLNNPVSHITPGAGANAIITGNVTGLSGFHGLSPIVDTNRFRAPLPSAGLSRFQAESVNLGQVLSGQQTYKPSFYFGRAETISNLGFVRDGLNIPGSSTLRSSTIAAPTALNPTPIDSLLIQPITADTRTQIGNGIQPFNPMMRQTKLTPIDKSQSSAAAMYDSAAGSSIFGTPPPNNSNYVSSDMNSPTMEEFRSLSNASSLGQTQNTALTSSTANLPPVTGQQAGSAGVLLPLYTSDPSRPAPSRDQTGPDLAEAQGKSANELMQQRRTQEKGRQREVTGLAQSANQTGMLVPLTSQDSSRQIGGNTSQIPQLPVQNTTLNRQSSAPPLVGSFSETRANQKQNQSEAAEETTQGIQEMATAAKWTHDSTQDPVRSFAGKYQGKMKEYVTAGEKALRAGQFYNAARWFDVASTIDPDDPLPLLGRGHALIAAGDYMSAFVSIRRGIERFPDIADYQLDLPGLIGRHDIFDIRRSDLEERLAKGEHYELRFLLGYLQFYSGLAEEGMRNLEEAAKGAPAHSIINRFPDLLLKRQN